MKKGELYREDRFSLDFVINKRLILAAGIFQEEYSPMLIKEYRDYCEDKCKLITDIFCV